MQVDQSSSANRTPLSALGSTEAGGPVRYFVVVADRFASFADGEQVFTMSQLMALLRAGATTGLGRQCVILPGQGIERADAEALESSGAILQTATGRGALSGDGAVPPATVHKSRPENVLISAFTTSSAANCSAALRIHRDNELVMDHLTGQHVSGMVVIEAMRQICIAQFETTYRPEFAQIDYRGIWRGMKLSFDGFLFALPASVDCEIVEADLRKAANLRFRAVTSVRQCGELVASAEIDYSMIRHDRLRVLESRRAARATRALLQAKGEM